MNLSTFCLKYVYSSPQKLYIASWASPQFTNRPKDQKRCVPSHPSPKVLFCQLSQHTLCIPLCSWMSFRAKKLVYPMLFYVHFQTCSYSTQDHSVASACFLLTPVFNFYSPKKSHLFVFIQYNRRKL